MARTFALVRPVFHRVSEGNQTVPNVPKWYEMQQNVRLGSNGVDRVHSMQKILTRLRGSNICTSSARFAPSFVSEPNSYECTQMVQNAPNYQFRVQWLDRVHSWRKILTRLRGTNFCTSSDRFAPSFVRQPNGPRCPQMVRNAPKRQFRPNVLDRVRSL